MKILNTILLLALLVSGNALFGQSIEEIREKIRVTELKAEELVSEQLKGYNEKNIDLFLRPYSDSVKVYQYPNDSIYSGKSKMKEQYERMFTKHPNLNCEITNRIVFGDKVVDRERITGFDKAGGFPDNWVMDALVIYTISGDKIMEVRFVSQLD
jgi:hypothetical protein